MRTPITVGVVCDARRACGLAEVFSQLAQAELRWVCEELPRFGRRHGSAAAHTHKLEHLLEDEQLDAVVFSSTGAAGDGRAKAALEADKHVLVAAPLAFTGAEAEELVAIARRRGCHAMTYSPWLRRPAIDRARRLVAQGALGELFYVDMQRHVPGAGATEDLRWGAGIPAVEVVLDLLGDEPVRVDARSESYLGLGVPDVIRASLEFATGINAHVLVSGVHGEAIDRLSIVGSEATAVVDSTDVEQRLTVIPSRAHRGFDELDGLGADRIGIVLPADDSAELACLRFVAAVRGVEQESESRVGSGALAVIEALTPVDRVEDQPIAPPEPTLVALRGN